MNSMDVLHEKKVFLWAVIIFFSLIAGLFYATRARRAEERGLVEQTRPTPNSSVSPTPFPVPFQGSAVKVQEDNAVHTIVRFDHGSFNPTEITVKNETGCFVDIRNESDQNITPRLGPYDPTQERGFLYPSIAPRAASLIDPRYGVTRQFSFYNKNDPRASFIVHIDPTCL